MNKQWQKYLLAAAVAMVSACSPQSSAPPVSEQPQVAANASDGMAEQSPAKSKRSCQFTMGFDVWEPYQYIGLGRKVQGLDIELVQMVAEKLECDIKYQQDSWGNLLSLLKVGKIDLVLGASITDERKTFSLFSEPYRSEEFQLYIRADEEHKHRQASVVDFVLEGNKLGTIGEYYYGNELSNLMDDQKYAKLINPAFMGEINMARLLDGDIEGFLEDSFVGATLIRRKGLEKYITAHQAKISTGDVYVMFSRASVKPELVAKFNKVLKSIKSNGDYDKLIYKYSQ